MLFLGVATLRNEQENAPEALFLLLQKPPGPCLSVLLETSKGDSGLRSHLLWKHRNSSLISLKKETPFHFVCINALKKLGTPSISKFSLALFSIIHRCHSWLETQRGCRRLQYRATLTTSQSRSRHTCPTSDCKAKGFIVMTTTVPVTYGTDEIIPEARTVLLAPRRVIPQLKKTSFSVSNWISLDSQCASAPTFLVINMLFCWNPCFDVAIRKTFSKLSLFEVLKTAVVGRHRTFWNSSKTRVSAEDHSCTASICFVMMEFNQGTRLLVELHDGSVSFSSTVHDINVTKLALVHSKTWKLLSPLIHYSKIFFFGGALLVSLFFFFKNSAFEKKKKRREVSCADGKSHFQSVRSPQVLHKHVRYQVIPTGWSQKFFFTKQETVHPKIYSILWC